MGQLKSAAWVNDISAEGSIARWATIDICEIWTMNNLLVF